MSEVFYREAGDGPPVVCIHSNGATSGQWRALSDLLAPKYRVLLPDSYGSGKSPEWPSDRKITLHDEVALLEPVFRKAGAPMVVVGHSYGGAIALRAAIENPDRVRALVLYEPTLFSLIEAEGPSPNDADGIRDTVARAAAALDAGDEDAAARHFIDFWMGEGSWARTSERSKPGIAASVRNVRRWAHALMTEPTPLPEFRALDMPVLYMIGEHTPHSAKGVARRLVPALRKVKQVEFAGLGHMGPIIHPDKVNAVIAEFLAGL